MSSGEITEEVERFVRDTIPSVEQLEVLLLLSGAPQKEWSAAQASQQLYRQSESVAACLEALRDRGVLSVRGEAELLYRYNSQAREHDIIQSLERAYKERKDAVIQIIFTAPHDNLRVFSNAFRIRRPD